METFGYCSDKDSTPYGACVADKPGYCTAGGAIVNNSIVCGCPEGMTANTTTLGCDGRRKVSFDIWSELSLSWILIIILLVPVGLYAAKIMHIFD
jgi:hypothetical protein